MTTIDTPFLKTLQTLKQVALSLVWWCTVIMNPILANQLREVRRELEDKKATIATLTARVEHLEHAEAALAPLVAEAEAPEAPLPPNLPPQQSEK